MSNTPPEAGPPRGGRARRLSRLLHATLHALLPWVDLIAKVLTAAAAALAIRHGLR